MFFGFEAVCSSAFLLPVIHLCGSLFSADVPNRQVVFIRETISGSFLFLLGKLLSPLTRRVSSCGRWHDITESFHAANDHIALVASFGHSRTVKSAPSHIEKRSKRMTITIRISVNLTSRI